MISRCLSYLKQSCSERLRFDNRNARSKRKKPTHIPIPVAGFAREADIALRPFFFHDLESSLLSNPLRRDWIYPNHRCHRRPRLVRPLQEFIERKIGTRLEARRQDRKFLNPVRPKIAIILAHSTPS